MIIFKSYKDIFWNKEIFYSYPTSIGFDMYNPCFRRWKFGWICSKKEFQLNANNPLDGSIGYIVKKFDHVGGGRYLYIEIQVEQVWTCSGGALQWGSSWTSRGVVRPGPCIGGTSPRPSPRPVNRRNGMTENITFPQFCWSAVDISQIALY